MLARYKRTNKEVMMIKFFLALIVYVLFIASISLQLLLCPGLLERILGFAIMISGGIGGGYLFKWLDRIGKLD